MYGCNVWSLWKGSSGCKTYLFKYYKRIIAERPYLVGIYTMLGTQIRQAIQCYQTACPMFSIFSNYAFFFIECNTIPQYFPKTIPFHFPCILLFFYLQ